MIDCYTELLYILLDDEISSYVYNVYGRETKTERLQTRIREASFVEFFRRAQLATAAAAEGEEAAAEDAAT